MTLNEKLSNFQPESLETDPCEIIWNPFSKHNSGKQNTIIGYGLIVSLIVGIIDHFTDVLTIVIYLKLYAETKEISTLYWGITAVFIWFTANLFLMTQYDKKYTDSLQEDPKSKKLLQCVQNSVSSISN